MFSSMAATHGELFSHTAVWVAESNPSIRFRFPAKGLPLHVQLEPFLNFPVVFFLTERLGQLGGALGVLYCGRKIADFGTGGGQGVDAKCIFESAQLDGALG